ncbi:MAG: YeeE/YedE thiosulfate transporter family protein [Thermoleophilia bacterium]
MNPLLQITAQSDEAVGIVGGTDFSAIAIGLLTGIAFGAILLRAGASSFTLIVNMLRLKNLTVMKFFFLAIGVGSVGMYLVDAFATAHIGIAPFYLLGIVAGGIVFGIGWAISGYCPGTALVAVAQGKVDAMVTVLGGLFGALTLALTWDYLEPVLVEPLNYGSKSIPDLLGARPLYVALALGVIAAAFVAYLNQVDKRNGIVSGSPLGTTAVKAPGNKP